MLPQPQFEENPATEPATTQDTPLPDVFGHTSPEPSDPVLVTEQPQVPQEERGDQDILDDEGIKNILAAFKEDWEADPKMEAINMSKILDTDPGTLMKAISPIQKLVKKEWNIIDRAPNCPDLDHHSENPYNFLPVIKLEKLIWHWRSKSMATDKLTVIDLAILGKLNMKKVLAKVVSMGPSLIEECKKKVWICDTIISVVTSVTQRTRALPRCWSWSTQQSWGTCG